MFIMDEKVVEQKRKMVMLTITENCNLDCIYCFEKKKTKNVMDLTIAKNIISYEFSNSDKFDLIEFHLFGGEPIMCKKMIKELVEWTCSQKFQKPFLFFIETNGTLVHGNFQTWLLKMTGIVFLGISIDGTRETHNKNRSNSYDKIDVDFFVNNYPYQPARLTVYNDTVKTLSKDVIHLHNLGFSEVSAEFANGITWNQDYVRIDLKRELEILCNYYLDNPETKECTIFDMNLPSILIKEEKIKQCCGAGISLISYDINGKNYPCHIFQPNTAIFSESAEINKIDFCKINDFRDPDCQNCILENVCPSCYGMNFVRNGNIFRRDKELCEIVKTQALAASYLKAKQIERNLKKMNPNEIYQTIEAIKIIQSSFFKN
jgi:radical SAM protein with 4Fe4S-binding SPASM domain